MIDSKQQFEDMREAETSITISEREWISAVGFSKQSNKSMADRIISDCEKGIINSLDAYLLTKSMENTIKIIQEGIKEYAMSDADKYGEKKFTHRNCEIGIVELGTKYNYESCNDPIWKEANEQVAKWDAVKKEREAFLKTINHSMDVIIEGEPLTIIAPTKTSTTGIKVIIK